MESAKPVPASALKIATYVAPTYPARASERNLEGWVDIEFTVGTDGKTRNIVVTDASHETIFRREATDAVAQVAVRAAHVHGPRDRADAPSRASASSCSGIRSSGAARCAAGRRGADAHTT